MRQYALVGSSGAFLFNETRYGQEFVGSVLVNETSPVAPVVTSTIKEVWWPVSYPDKKREHEHDPVLAAQLHADALRRQHRQAELQAAEQAERALKAAVPVEAPETEPELSPEARARLKALFPIEPIPALEIAKLETVSTDQLRIASEEEELALLLLLSA